MKRGDDISVRLPGLYLIHHNKPAIRVRRYVRPEHTWRSAGGGAHDVAVIPASQLVKELVFHLLLHPAVARPQALGAVTRSIAPRCD